MLNYNQVEGILNNHGLTMKFNSNEFKRIRTLRNKSIILAVGSLGGNKEKALMIAKELRALVNKNKGE